MLQPSEFCWLLHHHHQVFTIVLQQIRLCLGFVRFVLAHHGCYNSSFHKPSLFSAFHMCSLSIKNFWTPPTHLRPSEFCWIFLLNHQIFSIVLQQLKFTRIWGFVRFLLVHHGCYHSSFHQPSLFSAFHMCSSSICLFTTLQQQATQGKWVACWTLAKNWKLWW